MSQSPLPPIQGDAALAILVHRSLKPSVPNPNFGDGERLAFLGEQVLRMVVAEILFDKRSMLDASTLQVCAGLSHTPSPWLVCVEVESPQEELDQALSDEAYDQWVTEYGIRDRVVCPLNLREELKETAVQL